MPIEDATDSLQGTPSGGWGLSLDWADTHHHPTHGIHDAHDMDQSFCACHAASSLTSLTGVVFRADVAWFNIELQRFIDVIGDNGGGGAVGAGTAGGRGRLRHIEFGMRPISSVAQIQVGTQTSAQLTIQMNAPVCLFVFVQKLHRFRTTCLAPNAFESYHLSDGRDPRRQRQPLAIQLPFAGNINDLPPSIATAQALARHATHGTLHSHGGVHGQQAGQMWGSLVWAGITQLRIESRGYLPLPSYITGNPASFLPNVRSIVVAEGEVGLAFYDGGVGDVLRGLPSVEEATFHMRVRPDIDPTATLCLVPLGARHLLSGQGREVALTCHYSLDINNVPSQGSSSKKKNKKGGSGGAGGDGEGGGGAISWQVFGGGELGMGVQRAVRQISIHLGHRLHGDYAKAMYRMFADAVAQAFSHLPSLTSVVLCPTPRPRFNLASVLHEAAQKRFTVTPVRESDGGGCEMRRNAHKGGGEKAG